MQAIIDSVDKQSLLAELEAARNDLLDTLEGLPPDKMQITGVVGFWSVKDVLAHLVAWESETVTALNQAQNKRVPSIMNIDDIDGWNDQQYERNARRSLEAILDDFEGVHKMLFKMLSDFDETRLFDVRQYRWMEGEPLAYLIEENVTLHEREHAESIRVWRSENGF